MYKISISPEELEALPLTSFQGEIVVVDKIGRKYWEALDYLKSQTVIGFDTETRPSFGPGARHHKAALLQLAGADRTYLFRLNKIVFLKKVYRLLSDSNIVKVGAATADDVHGLQKYVKFHDESFVDLQRIVWEYGIRDKSVKKMAGIILGIRISKTQQLSNWEAKELSDAQKRYAATDAWVCREMYLKLMNSKKHPLTPEQLNPNANNTRSSDDNSKNNTQKR